MATAAFTTVVARVDQPLTNAIWADQIQDNINQLGGAHRNLLTNGGYEVWQRGAGGFTASSSYTADRWLLSISTGTATVTQETSVVDGSASALKIVTVGTVSQTISQKIENLAEVRGRTISLSVRVRQSVASAVIARISAAGGSSDSATSATTGSFVTLTVSLAVGAADAGPLSVTLAFSAAGTFYLDNAMLVIGPSPAPYQPLHPQEDLARCQRYYQVHSGISVLQSANGGSHVVGQWFPLPVPCANTPTVTKNGTWAVTNCGQPSVAVPSANGFRINATSSAAGQVEFTSNSADDTVTVEYNP